MGDEMSLEGMFREELAVLDREGAPSVDTRALAERSLRIAQGRSQARRRRVALSSLGAVAAVALLAVSMTNKPEEVGIAAEPAASLVKDPPSGRSDEQMSVAADQRLDEEKKTRKAENPAPTLREVRSAPLPAPPKKVLVEPPSAEELLATALRNRSGGDLKKASEQLRRLRTEHAGTPQAVLAAMYLARDAARQGNRGEARRLFRAATLEQPGGPLEREALGRLVELSEGKEKKASAKRYLKRHPDGPHAALARRTLGKKP